MLAPFITPILAALRWLGLHAFTGLTGAAIGAAFMSGFLTFIARAGISLITFGIIYVATQEMMAFALGQSIDPQIMSIMQATGLTVGINIMLSTLQAIIAIRIIKVSFRHSVVPV